MIAKVYGVATFFENFSLEAKGKHIVKVCNGTACHVRKSQPIYDAVREHLGLTGKRKTTDDGIFTLETVACLGAGGLAPVMTIGGEAHAKILERIGADKVIMPERDMGTRLARSLAGENIIDYMELSARHSLMEIEALEEWVGHTLKDSNIRSRYGINVVAIRSGKTLRVSPQGDDLIHDGDVLVVIGENSDLEKLHKIKKRKK